MEQNDKLASGKVSKNDALAQAPLTRESLAAMQAWASVMIKSGLSPSYIKHEEELILVLQKGRELGIPPMTALDTLYIIGGKVSLTAQAMLGLIMRSGKCVKWLPEYDEATEVWTILTKRIGMEGEMITQFGGAEADEIDYYDNKTKKWKPLTSKANWKNYRKDMLLHRCESRCARAYYADVVGGLYTPDELGADIVIDPVTEEVKVISIEVAGEPETPPAKQPEEAPPESTEPPTPEAEELKGSITAVGEKLGYSGAKIAADVDGCADEDELGFLLNEYEEVLGDKCEDKLDGTQFEEGKVQPLFEEGE